jgi:hypothetical protein
MAEPKPLNQESIVAQQTRDLFCVHERSDGVELEIPVVSTCNAIGMKCTNGISDHKNRVLELLRAVGGKFLNRTNWPKGRERAEEDGIRRYPPGMVDSLHTQVTK